MYDLRSVKVITSYFYIVLQKYDLLTSGVLGDYDSVLIHPFHPTVVWVIYTNKVCCFIDSKNDKPIYPPNLINICISKTKSTFRFSWMNETLNLLISNRSNFRQQYWSSELMQRSLR